MTTVAAPYYLPAGNEVDLFRIAADAHLPVMLVGPTGCGKTRFVRHMAAQLDRDLRTVVGNDDTTTSDLIGRFLIRGGDVEWRDGPVTTACRNGEFCYVDEVVEVRREALAALHPLADDRQELHIDRLGQTVHAAEGFMLVCSYNPSRSVGFRELRPAFRQRFVTIALDYLPPEQETEVVAREAALDNANAHYLVRVATALRDAAPDRTEETPSTRMLVSAGHMITRGTSRETAVNACVIAPITQGSHPGQDDAMRDLVSALR